MDVVHCVAFADGPGGGNPCPVVLGADGLDDGEMLAAAAGFGHETAFVLAPSAGSGAAVRLRYFVPRHEMEMCVHATVAAAVLLGLDDGARVETPLAVREVHRPGPDAATVTLGGPAEIGAPLGDDAVRRLAAALGAEPTGAVADVSVARPKLLVPLAGEAALDALAPDVEAVWALCDELRTTGVYVYTLDARGADVAARQFSVRAGYDEDPATGVAAGALAAWLAQERGGGSLRLRIAQGRAMGRPSLLEAQAREGAVAVGGRAERVAG